MLTAGHPLPFKAKFASRSPPPPKQISERDREYIRLDDVESMIRAARQVGRHGIRDAAIILLMFRHGRNIAKLQRGAI